LFDNFRATALDGGGHPAAASQKGVLRAPAPAMVPKAASNTRHRAAQHTEEQTPA
jgi:hypothetical protein